MTVNVKDLIAQVGTDTSGRWMSVDNVEQLARLIVQECIEQVWYTYEDKLNENISQIIKERIAKHFGVEE